MKVCMYIYIYYHIIYEYMGDNFHILGQTHINWSNIHQPVPCNPWLQPQTPRVQLSELSVFTSVLQDVGRLEMYQPEIDKYVYIYIQ